MKRNNEMLEQLGEELEEILDDLHFIGVQSGVGSIPDQCTFNCLRTGATIYGNSIDCLEERLEFVRNNYKPI